MNFTITTIANLHIFHPDLSTLLCTHSGTGARSEVRWWHRAMWSHPGIWSNVDARMYT